MEQNRNHGAITKRGERTYSPISSPFIICEDNRKQLGMGFLIYKLHIRDILLIENINPKGAYFSFRLNSRYALKVIKI